MFGILPDWVGDSLSLLALVLGTPGVVLFFLGRKGANRKLEVEEGGLSVTVFNAQTAAYKDLLDRANTRAANAEKEAKEANEKIDALQQEYAHMNSKINRLYNLFNRVLARNKIILTEEERTELEETKPTFVGKRRKK